METTILAQSHVLDPVDFPQEERYLAQTRSRLVGTSELEILIASVRVAEGYKSPMLACTE